MVNIGSLAVQLSLDAALFTSGLDKSTKEGKDFASTITKTFAGIGAGVSSLEAVGSGAASLYQGFKSGLHEIVATGQEAHKLGISFEALAGLQNLAGDNAEGLGKAMVRLGANMSKAAHGGKEAMVPFEQLGLDIQQLEAMSPEKAFGKVLDKINALQKAGDKGNVAKELFGREGLAIIEKFEKGTIGIDQAIAQIKAHGGVGFDEKDFKAALDAERSVKEMESTFNRIKLSLISEFAPIVKNVADGLADVTGKAAGKGAFKGLGEQAKDFLKGVVKGLIVVADVIGGIVDDIKSVTDNLPGSKGKKGGDKGLDLSAGGVAWKAFLGPLGDTFARNVLSETLSPGSVVGGGGNSNLGKAAHSSLDPFLATLDKIFAPGKDKPGTDKLTDPVDPEIGKLEEKLRGMVAEFGLGGEALERFKLAQHGATDAMLAGIDAELKQLKALEDAKKLHEEAKRIIEETQPPLDKFNERFGKLQEQLAAGNISKGQYGAALAKDFADLMPKHEAQHAPGALIEGSLAAHSAEVAFQRQGQHANVQDEIKAGIDRMVETSKQQAAYAKKLTEILPDLLQGRNPFP